MSKPHEDRTASFILIGIGIVPVVWAALIVAPFLSQGLKGIIEGFTIGMREPLSIQWCSESPKAILLHPSSCATLKRVLRRYQEQRKHGLF